MSRRVASDRKTDRLLSLRASANLPLPPEIALADMLNLTKGNDLVYWTVEDGEAVIHKVTQLFYGSISRPRRS